MWSGWDRLAARAAPGAVDGWLGRLGSLVLGLTLAACVNTGQIANLTDAPAATIALESIDGPPPAVVHRFMKTLKDEAASRGISVASPTQATYRLRGYLAAQTEGDAASISWALDVYDSAQRRAFRLSGEEKAAGRQWAAADDQMLVRIAGTGMDRFALFLATARPPATPAAAAPAPQRTSAAFDWLDDWAPESAGIFRIFRREPSRPAEIAAHAGAPVAPEHVPLPQGRPAPAGITPSPAFAFAPEDR